MSYTTQTFISKANAKHNNKYNYSQTNYKGSKDKVIIICPIHGEFQQIAAEHLRGKGCPECGGTKKSSTKKFIQKASLVHHNKYDYSKVEYVNNSTPVVIICPEHGEFKQTPNNHLNGQSCPVCANLYNPNIRLTTAQFITRANQIHNYKYDYSKVDYINSKTPITIICPKHGKYEQTPDKHLQGQGCPKCNQSKGEREIEKILQKNDIEYISQYQISVPRTIRKSGEIFVDFYLPKKNTIIEYNGIQHYIPVKQFGGEIIFEQQQLRDKYLRQYCQDNSIHLVEISYTESLDKIHSIINNLK